MAIAALALVEQPKPDVAVYVALERQIDDAEHDGIWRRWEFGKMLLAEREANGGQLPYKRIPELAQAVGKSPREIHYRAQFAERFDTEEKVCNALQTFKSWYAIINKALPKHNVPAKTAEPEIPTGPYVTIVADPPWRYSNSATRAAANDHYPTLTVQEICDLEVNGQPVREYVGDAGHVYLWTTNAFLREAFDVLDAWGFEYKTTLVWVKPQIGIGNYFRSSHEFVLFGVRGGLKVLDSNQRSWFEARRGRHSRKPDCFYDIVERVSPGPYLELFARPDMFGARPGWTVWGNEV